MPKQGAVITVVHPGSIGEEAGVEPGDRILSINGHNLEDIIDYRYLTADERLEIEIKKKNGQTWLLEVEKEYGEDLGLDFDQATFDGIRRCCNRCIFCFVDQMPPDLRTSLYVKDDDYRHSFIHGNFITLTNLTPRDWERIVRLRLSPLYISVHTTNPRLRAQMLGNPRAADIMEQLQRLKEAHIEMHTQIVLCPGINDGEELERTLRDLESLWPAVRSIAVVPVGLTCFREGLTELRVYSAEEARKIINQVKSFQAAFRRRRGSNLVFLADEFYLKAGVALPPAEHYEGFPQLENGVGLVRLFLDGYEETKKSLPSELPKPRKVVIITGMLAAPFLENMVQEISERVRGLEARVLALENGFFGPTVTVAGLLTGSDLIRGLKENRHIIKDDEVVIIPRIMLREGEDLFLDGLTVAQVADKTGAILETAGPEARELIEKILGSESIFTSEEV
ncbi:DUF512 domain-containing protein [Calderihabitans maritimus]|uniref:PDZ domain-containing protein n=1 Tax=Calderihabitans maritimus TaxID=1246530 RepID=A0A1Z5HUM1_9FIRM|nr:DUF512 domain-containing protein [Calderihabitans maritimus]GAW93236.1 hypothetical protein Moth_1323 [Calderihabitans maritimus]